MSQPDLQTALVRLRTTVAAQVTAAADLDALEALRLGLVGRSGKLTRLLRQVGDAPPDERPTLGALANEVRAEVESAIAERESDLRRASLAERLAHEWLDMTLPGRPLRVGHLHPLMSVERDLREIFHGLGFEVFEGPEIETDAMNFEALNIPPDHPARDLWDTLYVAERAAPGEPLLPAADGTILRTHTSPVQIRAMRTLQPPIRVITPGRCFRYEAIDASHASEFLQVEGLVVDRDTNLADLKGTLEEFARALYGPDVQTRFRPGYYPFTEPSAAFDIGCLVCEGPGGPGCPACRRSGWMTILGAGMVHPAVLRAGGLDPEEYQGYAFGMGLERITLLRHAIPDLRVLLAADLRFLQQFSEGR